MTRDCGTCCECCVQLAVKPLNKPPGVRCEHLLPIHDTHAMKSNGGCCAIYDERPQECRTFTCSWYDEQLPEDMKPDSVGVVFETMWVDTESRRLFILIGMATKKEASDISGKLHDWCIEHRYVGMVVPRMDESFPLQFFGTYPDIQTWVQYLQALKSGGARIQMAGQTINPSIPD